MSEIDTTPSISPEAVTSTNEAPSAPDSSILKGRMERVFREEPKPQSDTAALRDQLQQIRDMLGDRQKPKEPEVSPYDKRFKELEESHSRLERELAQRMEQQELHDFAKETSSWVSANETHFPLLNRAGYQAVVAQKVLNTKQQTGRILDPAQAAQEAEQELAALIHKCAPGLGYVKRDEKAARRDADKINPDNRDLDIELPTNLDEMTDEEELRYLLRQIGE
jgi:hypothetical protein